MNMEYVRNLFSRYSKQPMLRATWGDMEYQEAYGGYLYRVWRQYLVGRPITYVMTREIIWTPKTLEDWTPNKAEAVAVAWYDPDTGEITPAA